MARSTLCSIERPWAKPVAQALAKVQPVPWVWRLCKRGAAKIRAPSLDSVSSTEVEHAEPVHVQDDRGEALSPQRARSGRFLPA